MTDQHRAAPEQWEYVRDRAWEAPACDPVSSCLLELRARVEALEATQHAHADTSRLSDEERDSAFRDLSEPGRWQPLRTEITYGEAHAHAQGLVRHLSMDQALGPAPSPTDSLVERVEAAIDEADIETGCQARAAIREVAAWLRELDPEPGPIGRWLGQISTPCSVMADELERKASQ